MSVGHVVFSHGRDSGPEGSKIVAMSARVRALGWTTESVDYRGMSDAAERVAKLLSVAGSGQHAMLVLVGSSMGGYVANEAAQSLHPAGVFLIAPAFFMPGYALSPPQPAHFPCTIVHGLHDEIVPVEHSLRYAKSAAAELHAIDGDHRLLDRTADICTYLERFLLSL